MDEGENDLECVMCLDTFSPVRSCSSLLGIRACKVVLILVVRASLGQSESADAVQLRHEPHELPHELPHGVEEPQCQVSRVSRVPLLRRLTSGTGHARHE